MKSFIYELIKSGDKKLDEILCDFIRFINSDDHSIDDSLDEFQNILRNYINNESVSNKIQLGLWERYETERFIRLIIEHVNKLNIKDYKEKTEKKEEASAKNTEEQQRKIKNLEDLYDQEKKAYESVCKKLKKEKQRSQEYKNQLAYKDSEVVEKTEKNRLIAEQTRFIEEELNKSKETIMDLEKQRDETQRQINDLQRLCNQEKDKNESLKKENFKANEKKGLFTCELRKSVKREDKFKKELSKTKEKYELLEEKEEQKNHDIYKNLNEEAHNVDTAVRTLQKIHEDYITEDNFHNALDESVLTGYESDGGRSVISDIDPLKGKPKKIRTRVLSSIEDNSDLKLLEFQQEIVKLKEENDVLTDKLKEKETAKETTNFGQVLEIQKLRTKLINANKNVKQKITENQEVQQDLDNKDLENAELEIKFNLNTKELKEATDKLKEKDDKLKEKDDIIEALSKQNDDLNRVMDVTDSEGEIEEEFSDSRSKIKSYEKEIKTKKHKR